MRGPLLVTKNEKEVVDRNDTDKGPKLPRFVLSAFQAVKILVYFTLT